MKDAPVSMSAKKELIKEALKHLSLGLVLIVAADSNTSPSQLGTCLRTLLQYRARPHGGTAGQSALNESITFSSLIHSNSNKLNKLAFFNSSALLF